jgi:hypothetical protein
MQGDGLVAYLSLLKSVDVALDFGGRYIFNGPVSALFQVGEEGFGNSEVAGLGFIAFSFDPVSEPLTDGIGLQRSTVFRSRISDKTLRT